MRTNKNVALDDTNNYVVHIFLWLGMRRKRQWQDVCVACVRQREGLVVSPAARRGPCSPALCEPAATPSCDAVWDAAGDNHILVTSRVLLPVSYGGEQGAAPQFAPS